MNEEARAARRAYYKEWRRKNADKVKASINRYWQKKAERAAATDDEAEQKKEKD